MHRGVHVGERETGYGADLIRLGHRACDDAHQVRRLVDEDVDPEDVSADRQIVARARESECDVGKVRSDGVGTVDERRVHDDHLVVARRRQLATDALTVCVGHVLDDLIRNRNVVR